MAKGKSYTIFVAGFFLLRHDENLCYNIYIFINYNVYWFEKIFIGNVLIDFSEQIFSNFDVYFLVLFRKDFLLFD